MEEWLCVSLLDKCVNAFEHDVKMTLVAMEVPNLILNADGVSTLSVNRLIDWEQILTFWT